MNSIKFTGILTDLIIVFGFSLFLVLPMLELFLNYEGVNAGWSLIHSLALTLCCYNIYKWNKR